MNKKVYTALILIVIVVIASQIMNYSQTVLHEVEDIDINKLDSNVLSWVLSHTGSEGIYIARIPNSRKVEEYYVFINIAGTYSVSIGNANVDRNSLKVDTKNPAFSVPTELEMRKPNPLLNRISKITTKNKRARYFYVNGEKVQVSALEVIK